MGVHQPSLVARDFAIGVLELDLAAAGGFDLCSGENQARFHSVREEIVVPSRPVVAQNLNFGFHEAYPNSVKGL